LISGERGGTFFLLEKPNDIFPRCGCGAHRVALRGPVFFKGHNPWGIFPEYFPICEGGLFEIFVPDTVSKTTLTFNQHHSSFPLVYFFGVLFQRLLYRKTQRTGDRRVRRFHVFWWLFSILLPNPPFLLRCVDNLKGVQP